MLQPLVDSSTERTTSQKEDTFELKIERRRFLPFSQLVEQSCPQLATPFYQESFQKDLAKVVFQLELTSQYHRWTIIKRIEDFVQLEKQLRQHHRSKIMGVPVRRQADNDNSQLLLEFYELFLQQLSKHSEVRFNRDFLAFIEQPMLYERRRLKVYKQEWLRKRAGGRFNHGYCQGCSTLFGNWKRRFFTVTSEGIFYTKGFEPEESAVLEMVPFSAQFAVEYGLRQTGYKFGVVLNSCQRKLQLIPNDFWSFVLFIHAVKKSLAENRYLESNRFESFAKEREGCWGKFYADGEDYFRDMYEEMSMAKREIFITGWMVTPFFVMVRPNSLDSDYRLDKVLKRCAERGVAVHIIVFQEPKLALNNDSEYTKRYLQSLHSNIKVMRHPKYLLIPFLWSHHEKLVVVDQKVGFLGGLDLCYGRMDNSKHKLTDIVEPYMWEGADYSNLRVSDIYTPRQYETSMLDRTKTPRMPWHDVAVQLRGDSVIDLVRHFVQYWNFVNFQNKLNDRELLIHAGISPSEELEEEVRHNKEAAQRLRKEVQQQQVNERRNTMGLNLQRDLKEQEEKKQASRPKLKRTRSDSLSLATQLTSKPFSTIVDPNKTVDMFVHKKSEDLASEVHPTQSLAQERQFYRQHLAQHQPPEPTLSENINTKLHEKWEKLKEMGERAKDLLLNRQAAPAKDEQLIVAGGVQTSLRRGRQRHQILRSASLWGLGVQPTERSIYNAYLQLITSAKHSIYIENQFFMGEQNEVANALVHRINQAHHEKEKFKVLVVLPLLPGFEGEVDNEASAVLRLQLHLQYKTISRGESSLLHKLKHIDAIGEYVQFYGLRTHAKLNGKPVTEIVYVHSKLLIVDDRVVLIGSANINDRSMLGSRDSEVAVLIEDEEMLNIGTEQEPVEAAAFAHKLRTQLYMEHFALTEKEARNPCDEDVWWLINERCRKNSLLYREIFACYPDSEVRSLAHFREFQKKCKHDRYQLLHEMIVGNGVEFPLTFLEQQSLALRANQMEYYVPSISFT